jgi:hypothetical protein
MAVFREKIIFSKFESLQKKQRQSRKEKLCGFFAALRALLILFFLAAHYEHITPLAF